MIMNEPTFHPDATLLTQQPFLVSEFCQVRRLFELLSFFAKFPVDTQELGSIQADKGSGQRGHDLTALRFMASQRVMNSKMNIQCVSECVMWLRVSETKHWLQEHHSPSPIIADLLGHQIKNGHYFTAVMGKLQKTTTARLKLPQWFCPINVIFSLLYLIYE